MNFIQPRLFSTINRRRAGRVRGASLIFAVVGLCVAACAGVEAAPRAVVPDDAPRWSAKLDGGDVRFYQATELGVLVAGTERALYALDAATGDTLWRRKNARLDERDVVAVPGTDLLLLNFEHGGRTRIEAVDVLTGDLVWQSERVRGAVMQLAIDVERRLLAVVLVRDARGRARAGFERKPVVHLLDLATGEQLWKREAEKDVEMMPARWSENESDETTYTLDNYRAPLFLDGRLYYFYVGVSSVDALTGKDRLRESFRVNEEGLALTEADPVFDEGSLYLSGRGRVRAISRADGRDRVGSERPRPDAGVDSRRTQFSMFARADSSRACATARRSSVGLTA